MRHSRVVGWIVVIILFLLALFGSILFVDLITRRPIVRPNFTAAFERGDSAGLAPAAEPRSVGASAGGRVLCA